MEEIASQFREELQEIIDRYKTRLSVPSIIHVAQDLLKYLPKENIEGIYEATEAAEEFLRNGGIRCID